MRQLNLKNVGSNISDEMIATTEKEIGVKIPLIYKEFLKQNNGGDMPKLAKTSKFDIRDFLSINESNDSLQGIFSVISNIFDDSKNWLPFGFDVGDWIYCICLKEDKYGQIYLMRTDEIEEDEGFIFTANSFEEFLDGLQPESTVL